LDRRQATEDHLELSGLSWLCFVVKYQGYLEWSFHIDPTNVKSPPAGLEWILRSFFLGVRKWRPILATSSSKCGGGRPAQKVFPLARVGNTQERSSLRWTKLAGIES